MITESSIRQTDASGMFDVLCSFNKQIKEAIEIGLELKIPADLSNLRNIVISGLGGSAIGGDLVRSFIADEIKIPVYVNRSYFLPAFADENSLAVISSYSGNTEESLSSYEDAKRRNCKIVCISSGGKLRVLAQSEGNYLITIPSGYQPRCALAYSFITLLFLIQAAGYISDKSSEAKDLINTTTEKVSTYSRFENGDNPSLNIAEHLQGKIPVIYSSNNLLDIVNLRWRCQINENSKKLAFGNVLPEMNHNEIVGWEANPELLKNLGVVFLKDKDDYERISMREEITRDIIKPFAGLIFEISSDCSSKLARIIDLIYLGDWVSFYLAILNKIDPTPVEKINILKSKLTEL